MSSAIPIHAEAAPVAETAPLLGPNASDVSNAAQAKSNGTFPGVNGDATADVENGRTNGTGDNAPGGYAPKLKANMKALLPALAVGVSRRMYNNYYARVRKIGN